MGLVVKNQLPFQIGDAPFQMELKGDSDQVSVGKKAGHERGDPLGKIHMDVSQIHDLLHSLELFL